MDGNYIGDDTDSEGKLYNNKQRTNYQNNTNNITTTIHNNNENINRYAAHNGILRNRHRQGTNNDDVYNLIYNANHNDNNYQRHRHIQYQQQHQQQQQPF